MKAGRAPGARWAAAAFLLAVALAGCGLSPTRTPGERLYRKRCARCHGVDGSGNTPLLLADGWADLTDGDWHQSPEDMDGVIRDGVFGKMPANPDLSESEIAALVTYVRTLAGDTYGLDDDRVSDDGAPDDG